MRVVLFGAGASFGSESTTRVPPLGGKLFDELIRYAPQTWGALPSPWPTRFRSNFEGAMSTFINGGGFGAPLQWDMATYFFTQFSATRSSTYVRLLSGLSKNIQRYLFVTLNYELLLFQARAHADVPVEHFKVCLPHGNSCVCCSGISATGGISFTGGISTGGTARVFRDMQDFMSERASNVFPPVMSYYEPNKFTASCANFIDAERRRFEQGVLSADKIALVGVRVHHVDRHIWEPLGKTKATLLYLAGASAARDFSAWSSSKNRSQDVVVPKYFNDGVSDLLGFLSS